MFIDEASEADWEDTEVDREINVGFHKVVTSVMETYENYYVIKSQFNTVADQQEYNSTHGVPTDIFKIKRVEINYNPSVSGATPSRAKPVDMEEVTTNLGSTLIGSTVTNLAAYYIYGQGSGSSGFHIGFIPIPDEAGTNAVSLWYVPVQADLSDANTNVNIPYADNYYHLISLYAASTLLRKGQQEEEVAAKYMNEFNIGLLQMKQQLEERVSDSARSVIDTRRDDIDFWMPT